ncbi:MAG TPA: DUF2975 domain-containing protein [Clostridia bacterium]|nr:DUF2975 domain-containing protein [Clostridia bacterium]
MKRFHPSAWLRLAIPPVGACLAALDFFIIPTWGWSIATSSPELNVYFWPWLIFVLLASAPIYAALVALWKLSAEFKKERPVGEAGAKLLRLISFLALGDSAFTLLGIIVLGALNLGQPGVMMLLFFAVVAGLGVAAAAAAFADAFKRMEQLTIT